MLTFDNPTGAAPPQANYSQAAVINLGSARMIMPAGQTATGLDGGIVGVGDFTAQVRRAFENIVAILDAHGAGVTDIVKTTYYVTDMANRAELGAVRDEVMGEHMPASTLLEVSALAQPEYMVEIDVVAVVAG